MLLTHTKLVLGNNITYMSAYNYFSAVPMVLLMELKIINDADKYLDKYIEMVRENLIILILFVCLQRILILKRME
jgi:hypothetical protein